MKKRKLMDMHMDELIANRDISDESIYVIYQFLTDLLTEFETKAFGRLRSYNEDQKALQKEINSQIEKNNPSF